MFLGEPLPVLDSMTNFEADYSLFVVSCYSPCPYNALHVSVHLRYEAFLL